MKEYIITVEVYDDTSLEKMEDIIDAAFNENFVNCTYEVEENEKNE